MRKMLKSKTVAPSEAKNDHVGQVV